MRKPKRHKPLNDLSRSPTALNVNETLIAVIELSQTTWLVAGKPSAIATRLRQAVDVAGTDRVGDPNEGAHNARSQLSARSS